MQPLQPLTRPSRPVPAQPWFVRALPVVSPLVVALLALLAVVLLSHAPEAAAQTSKVCETPRGRCTATYAGPRGAPCSCKLPEGWVRGRLV
jgi:hypothetical protein